MLGAAPPDAGGRRLKPSALAPGPGLGEVRPERGPAFGCSPQGHRSHARLRRTPCGVWVPLPGPARRAGFAHSGLSLGGTGACSRLRGWGAGGPAEGRALGDATPGTLRQWLDRLCWQRWFCRPPTCSGSRAPGGPGVVWLQPPFRVPVVSGRLPTPGQGPQACPCLPSGHVWPRVTAVGRKCHLLSDPDSGSSVWRLRSWWWGLPFHVPGGPDSEPVSRRLHVRGQPGTGLPAWVLA